MLRNVLIAIGALCLAGAVVALVLHSVPSALMLAVWGAILVLGTLYERVRYKPILASRPRNASRTAERFVDDETGKPVTVYVDPATGERSYVEE